MIRRMFLLALTLALILPATVYGQTSLNETTLSSAVTSTSQTSIVLASATGIADGYGIYVDREYMTVASTWTSGTTIPVIRRSGVSTHAASTPVYIGPPSAFITSNPSGSCTAANIDYLPKINIETGDIWDCSSTVEKWVNLRDITVVTCQSGPLAADSIDQSCFTANRPYLVYKITYVAKTAESAGTLTLIPRRQQGTEAPASGDALATAINCVAAGTAAETVVTATLTATEANLILATGDRLGLDFTDDVAGELAGVVVTFYLYPM